MSLHEEALKASRPRIPKSRIDEIRESLTEVESDELDVALRDPLVSFKGLARALRDRGHAISPDAVSDYVSRHGLR